MKKFITMFAAVFFTAFAGVAVACLGNACPSGSGGFSGGYHFGGSGEWSQYGKGWTSPGGSSSVGTFGQLTQGFGLSADSCKGGCPANSLNFFADGVFGTRTTSAVEGGSFTEGGAVGQQYFKGQFGASGSTRSWGH